MFNTAKPVRDAFTLSLGGMTTIASFVVAPAIADDRITKIRDRRLAEASPGASNDSDAAAESWQPGHNQAA